MYPIMAISRIPIKASISTWVVGFCVRRREDSVLAQPNDLSDDPRFYSSDFSNNNGEFIY